MSWEIGFDGQSRYINYLKRIVDDDEQFSKFRKNIDIKGIIEGVTERAGWSYLKKIETLDSKWLDDNWDRISQSDVVGDPDRIVFRPGKVPLAPVNLRYAWNALELDREIGIRGKSIVEIGGGYGGLARVICSLFDPAEYSIIDILEAQAVARKFLSKLYTRTINFLPLDSVVSPDVFIANYSVAEFDRAEQRKYLDNVILRSGCGYFTHNIPFPSSKQMSRREFEEEFSRRFDVRSYVEGLHKCEMSVVYVCKEKKEAT